MADPLARKVTRSPGARAEKDGGDGGDDVDLAVLLIHGIGDIARGDVLGMSVAAIRRHLPDVTVVGEAGGFDDPAEAGPEGVDAVVAGRGAVSAVDLRWGDRSIRVVEYSWAPVVGKIRLGRPLLALRRMLETLRELPTMAAAGTPSPRVERWAPRAGRFQRGVVLWMVLLLIPVVVELSLRPEFAVWLGEVLPTVGSDPSTNIVVLIGGRLWEGRYVFSLALAALYLIAGLYYAFVVAGFGYFLVAWMVFRRRLRPVGVFLRALAASSVLTFFVALGVVMVAALPIVGLEGASRHFETSGVDAWSVAYAAFIGLFQLGVLYGLAVKPALVVTNLLRDAVHYLATGPNGGLLPHQRTIRAELEALVRRLLGPDGRTHLVVVAHSLGTVIFTDLLRHRAGAMADDAEGAATLDLVTAGSPLRRLVHRLFPYRLPDASTLARELRRGPLVVRQWHNAYRLFDYVGQALTFSALPMDLLAMRRKAQDPASGIADQLLTPRWAWPLAHANYWGDTRFLDFVAERVARPVLSAD